MTMTKPKKVLVLGSGSLKIGEAGEFDYSGSQCLKALREEGIKTVLVNPNIATIQTSEGMADKIYFLPVTPYFVEKVIEKEKPYGIMLSFGGQTALNCGVALANMDVFDKYNVKVLGTQIDAIKNTEDRELFVKKLNEINLKVPESEAVTSIEQAVEVARKLKYPIMLRVAYALGGQGSGVVLNENELKEKAKQSFAFSTQILVEKYLGGWKEIEYEVVRDAYDNCITVCNMENFDPMGIHTGESIVVAPSQTLTNSEYHKLRDISIKVIRHLGIVGECNIQFALEPFSEDYRIIEVNARLSRSSALASKATGYPLAFIAAKLALGYSLIELENMITKATKSCFEPALDYVVVKMPRWDLQKFKRVSLEIGSEMKSVGEVMAIGRKFEEAMQKAIRMLSVGLHGLVGNSLEFGSLEKELSNPTDKRLLAIAEAIKKGISIDKIHHLTKIDKWFLHKIKNVAEVESKLSIFSIDNLPEDLLKLAKQYGFSDFQIAKLLQKNSSLEKNFFAKDMTTALLEVRELRKKHNILPVVKQIDTLAAEYPAKTNYLYLTYNGEEDDIKFDDEKIHSKNEFFRKSVIVLGSGAYRIGSSVEFDWCCVNSVFTLKKLGYSAIMINCNPETVSTDYDVCDRLYFDELSFERVLDIYEKENLVVISKFITNAKEIEIDAVAQDGNVAIYAISEHIENAGVHSGDATMALPPQYTYFETIKRIKETTKKIAKSLKITGPFNIQFIAKDNQIKVIECNLRASRSFPFVSKVSKHNFIDLATKAMLGLDISGRYNTLDLDYVGVKAPQFSFSRLHGADPMLSVEMASTGEVACLGDDINEAFLKSLLSVGFVMPKSSILLSTGPIKSKAYLFEGIKKLAEMGFKLYATEGTSKFLVQNGVKCSILHWPLDKKEPNALTYIQERKVDLVINIPKSHEEKELTNDYLIRRKAVDFNIPLLTNAQITRLFIESISKKKMEDLEIKSWDEY